MMSSASPRVVALNSNATEALAAMCVNDDDYVPLIDDLSVTLFGVSLSDK